ncbi:MAG: hypothetical protein M3Z54_14475 [Gemmatimonadota bacterium]|nr:hypothetical protein [Gemmatimonadota bacterium]
MLIVGGYEVLRTVRGSLPVFSVLAGATVGLAFVGWMDDKGSMRVPIRLALHLLCGLAIALLLNVLAPLRGILNVAWLTWWMFWAMASINIVNFMDGLDGMIAAQGLVYGIFLFALLPYSTLGHGFGLILAAACFGFLIWNWAPAKVFMGDVGSGPLGLFFVIGGALALEGAPATLVFLPLFPLFLDALLTMIIRFRRRARLTDAHRSHLYQRLANGGYGHARITLLYAMAASIGAFVALSVIDSSAWHIVAAILLYTFVVLLGWRSLHNRFPE